jgi:WD40 repeat protein
MLAVGRSDGRLSLWDVKNRQQPKLIKTLALRSVLMTLGFSPDGRTMAVGEGYNISMWDLTNPADPQRLTSIYLKQFFSQYNALTFAFSPDGQTMAVATDLDRSAVLWNVSDPAQPSRIAVLGGHADTINYLAFTPDGNTLVTTSGDNVALLWDVTDPATPLRFATLKTPDMQSSAAALSKDGRILAVGGKVGDPNQTLMLWDTTLPKDLAADPVRYACTAAGRGLSTEEWARYVPELPYRSTC